MGRRWRRVLWIRKVGGSVGGVQGSRRWPELPGGSRAMYGEVEFFLGGVVMGGRGGCRWRRHEGLGRCCHGVSML